MKIKHEHNRVENKGGFTLVEILVSISILGAIIGLIGAFQADVFSVSRIIQSGLNNQNEAKKVIRPFANEVRSASPSSLGAYPIKSASTTEFVFYSDIDNDNLKEEVRYYLDGGDFKKGFIKPTGQPLVYDPENEEVINIIHDVLDEVIFEYYDSSYDGTASSTPLAQPVAPSNVRLVKISMTIDSDPNKPPAPLYITTQVSIRNLKDNL